MLYAINYADHNFSMAQKLNCQTAISKGKVDRVISYTSCDLDEEFKKRNSSILNQTRGGGYWLWKPYVILKTLEKISNDDYVFYADSGSYYINSVWNLVEVMEKNNDSIMCFQMPLVEKAWTKRDAFIIMGCDNDYYKNSMQIMATCLLIKKNIVTVNFVKKWLDYCENEQILTDLTNQKGTNDDLFADHRHDQSIFSLLCKQEGIKPYRDPSWCLNEFLEWGKYKGYTPNVECQTSNYPPILALHRLKNCRCFSVKVWLRTNAMGKKLLNGSKKILPGCLFKLMKR